MKAVIQRVKYARCIVEGETVGQTEKGLCVMLGVRDGDSEAEAEQLAAKISKMRIFCDENDKMNLDVNAVGGGILVISNFTLCGNCSHGNRPDFTGAMKPDRANELYEYFVSLLKKSVPHVETGRFGAHMEIEARLDGPITLSVDSEELKRGKRH